MGKGKGLDVLKRIIFTYKIAIIIIIINHTNVTEKVVWEKVKLKKKRWKSGDSHCLFVGGISYGLFVLVNKVVL